MDEASGLFLAVMTSTTSSFQCFDSVGSVTAVACIHFAKYSQTFSFGTATGREPIEKKTNSGSSGKLLFKWCLEVNLQENHETDG